MSVGHYIIETRDFFIFFEKILNFFVRISGECGTIIKRGVLFAKKWFLMVAYIFLFISYTQTWVSYIDNKNILPLKGSNINLPCKE